MDHHSHHHHPHESHHSADCKITSSPYYKCQHEPVKENDKTNTDSLNNCNNSDDSSDSPHHYHELDYQQDLLVGTKIAVSDCRKCLDGNLEHNTTRDGDHMPPTVVPKKRIPITLSPNGPCVHSCPCRKTGNLPLNALYPLKEDDRMEDALPHLKKK